MTARTAMANAAAISAPAGPPTGVVWLVSERRPPKAADIDGDALLAAIWAYIEFSGHRAAQCWDIEPWYPSIPPKVVRAKLARLIAKGWLDGCACGCRGDFTLTAAGLIRLTEWTYHERRLSMLALRQGLIEEGTYSHG